MTESTFIHRFEPATSAGSPPLLLLHGTGGDENDLLGLGKMISPGSALLSPRGRVLEHGMPRFFRRLAEGVFDEEDVRRRALELGDFVTEASKQYGIAAPVAVGFSNGANIAAALLLLKPDVLAGAILLRAMVPLSDPPENQPAKPELGGKPILLLSGQADPIVPASNSARLAALLSQAGAGVTHKVLPAGHQLSQADVTLARDWIGSVAAEAA
ncbi:alpha/beta hydrolase [Bradyrhizobium liaoningense]|uniref:alpha/beta hydrolase n=1 Tax=Bradyrhizobium liaoningense TaxID=43992 RepID=UPI001BA766B9|nr:alpha/beta hydrolase [Bradyrhizobium liaoningense]MBR0710469.1 alpha/beta hydrolase [Bradyrhizobium liaoningense]